MKELSKMPHNKFIVRLLDLLICPEHLNDGKLGIFIIMEHFGQDLKSLLSDRYELSDKHIITILYNILCALRFLHSSNVLHRDLKPANILIDEDCNIKLCDLGLSRTLPKSCIGKGSGNSKRMRDSILKSDLSHMSGETAFREIIAQKLTN